MRLYDLNLESTEGGFTASIAVETAHGPNGRLWYEATHGHPVPPTPEMAASAFAAACLPAAVWYEEDLEIEPLLDHDFLFRLPRLARGHARMHERRRTTEIHAIGTTSEPRPNRVAGMSFTGGVDSFYTLRDNLDPDGVTPIRALVTGLGLDTKVVDPEGHAALLDHLGVVAHEFDLRHFAIHTNFREFFDPYADPSLVTQGACLVAFAFLLSGELSHYLIPASAPIDRLYPYSSHALIDGQWISRPICTVSDGWDIHRNDKLATLVDWPLAMRELRVCINDPGIVNCGRCEKCLRTMALLALNGVLDLPAFPHRLEARHIRRIRIFKPKKHYWWEQIYKSARRNPETAWLARATAQMLVKMKILTPIKGRRLKKKARKRWPLRKLD